MRIALIGYGKMGKAIEELIDPVNEEIIMRVSRANLKDLNGDSIRNADIAIEFTSPESAFDNIKLCLENGIPVVSGSTGWLDKFERIKEICALNDTAFFYASNFSLGMNIFMHINKILGGIMNSNPQYEVEIEEVHHIHKLDAPSGTAITLAVDLISKLDSKNSWILDEDSSSDKLCIRSKRENEVPGTHIISYDSDVDKIEIKHEAHNRKGFALGAIAAARWTIGKNGCFGMQDMLKLT